MGASTKNNNDDIEMGNTGTTMIQNISTTSIILSSYFTSQPLTSAIQEESIDDKTAKKLFDSGFTSVDALTIATVSDIAKVPGIKKRKAKKIKKELEKNQEELAQVGIVHRNDPTTELLPHMSNVSLATPGTTEFHPRLSTGFRPTRRQTAAMDALEPR